MKKYDEFLKENKAKKIWNAAVYVRLSKYFERICKS